MTLDANPNTARLGSELPVVDIPTGPEQPSGAASPAESIELRLFGRTDVGRVREHNEDNFLVADLTAKTRGLRERDRQRTVGPGGNVFGVCDGMGGAAAGEVASQLAVDVIYEVLSGCSQPATRDDLARNLVDAVQQAGTRIYEEARTNRARRGMGTTSTIGVMLDQRLFLAQVGDSRAYLLRGDRFVQLTRDQSLVNQLIEAGQLTEEEAETFEHNNIILQALGTAETVQVDLTYADLRRGDTLLMCSDGLSGMVRDVEMKEILLKAPEPVDACRELTERANNAGGHDNITVLVVKFDGSGLSAPGSSDEPLMYRKYELDEEDVPGSVNRTLPVPPAPSPPTRQEPAQTSKRELRVGHTVFGMAVPVNPAQAVPSDEAPEQEVGSPPREDRASLSALLPMTVSNRTFGLTVLACLALVAAVGFLLLR